MTLRTKAIAGNGRWGQARLYKLIPQRYGFVLACSEGEWEGDRQANGCSSAR